jgi:hypothetical protein
MHYFIDHSQLPTQNSVDTFGPDNSNPTNKFNITSRFQLTGQAKAFACQDGMMIVQQSSVNESLVNIILKPIGGLKIPFNSVKYFVYRGLSKDSLIVGTGIKPKSQAPENSLLQRFWKDVDSWNAHLAPSNQTSPTPKSLGYDNSLLGTLDIEKIFDNSQIDTRAIFVKEGEWIADFAFQDSYGNPVKIGFEIIMETDSLTLDLNYLRASNYQIEITTESDLELRAKRDLILSYIDPAAFFGLHYDAGINISVFNGSTKTLVNKKQSDLYILLLGKFATKNRVYLDIRSEKGYSYNFYQNYNGSGNNIKIGNSTIAPTEQIYNYNAWPIVIIDIPITTTASNNDIKINLCINDNTKPILFFQNKKLLGEKNNVVFINEKQILNETATDWSKDLNFFFPNTGTGSSKDNVAYYIKLSYFRQEYNSASPNTVLKNVNYFDSAFCPIDLTNLADSNYLFKQVHNSDLNFVRGQLPNISNEFGYVADTGAYWDNSRIVFYSQAIFQNKRTGEFYSTSKGVENKFLLNNKYFESSFLKNDVNINCKIFQEETGVNQYAPFKSIAISHYNGFPNAKENLLLLGIKLDELQSLIDAANEINSNTQLPNLSPKHHRHLFLEEDLPSPKTDKDGKLFRKFKLKIQGLDSNGVGSIVDPNDDIFLYTRDGLSFTSKEFAESETVNDVSSFIEIIPLDIDTNDPLKNLYKSIKRLSMNTIGTLNWQLYDLDGLPQKYETGETDYAGVSIAGQEIKLPVGTRVLILGYSKKQINNFFGYYIVGFHEGTYREGFVDTKAFNNSTPRINNKEGVLHPNILPKVFLDDAAHILNYIGGRLAYLSSIGQPAYTPLINFYNSTLSDFNDIKTKPLSSLETPLLFLINDLHKTDLYNTALNNFGANKNNKPDSVKRWINFPSFSELSLGLSTLYGKKIIYVPLSNDWFDEWENKDATFKGFVDSSTDIQTLKSSLPGDSGENIPSGTQPFTTIQTALNQLKSFVSSSINNLFKNSPEGKWLANDLNVSDLFDATHFIIIFDNTWNIANKDLFYSSRAMTDSSIGYLDNDYVFSLLIHETNVLSGSVAILSRDTHLNINTLQSDFINITNALIDNLSALSYFPIDNNGRIMPYDSIKEYHFLFQYNVFAAIIYLRYYLGYLKNHS